MNLEQLQIKLKSRDSWVAVDFGTKLASRWWLRMFGAGLMVIIPFAAIAVVVDRFWLSLFIVWFMKPVYERAMLSTLSAAVFNDKHSLLKIAKDVIHCLISFEFFRARFQIRRSVLAPVYLEELGRGLGTVRRFSLTRSGMAGSTWLMSVGFVFEISLFFILLMTIPGFLPFLSDSLIVVDYSGTSVPFADYWDYITALPILVTICLFSFVVLAVAPLFVSCGFSVYLNQRTRLEGWDIEIEFRKLIQRIGVILLFVFVIPPSMLRAEVAEHPRYTTADPVIREIADDPMFNREQYILLPSFLETLVQPREIERPSRNPLAMLIRILMWMVFLAFVVWLIILFVEKGSFSNPFRRKSPRDPLAELYIQSRKLPSDIVDAATTAFNHGRIRFAVGLLYAGAIDRLLKKYACDIEVGSTESECIEAVAGLEPDLQTVFKDITQTWQHVAFASAAIERSVFSALIQKYRDHFSVEIR